MMRAARLIEGETRLRIEQVPVPEPAGDQVLVRVVGAGVCHSDLHVLDGLFADVIRRPVTMGHEIAGRVEATGPAVRDLEAGEAVVVMVGWGCGHCRWCVSGREQLCAQGDEAGATVDGGFAEFVLVPHRRHLVKLGSVDPEQAIPFGCAALCAYAAVRRVKPNLAADSTLVVVGLGGLGQYGIQFARRLSSGPIVGVDLDEGKLAQALELGADRGVQAGADAAGEILGLTNGAGADAVIDFVGSDESLALAAQVVGVRGVVALLGLAGGAVPFGFSSLAPEAALTTVVAGTIRDLQEVVGVAQRERLAIDLRMYEIEQINVALDDLRAGAVRGRAVVVP